MIDLLVVFFVVAGLGAIVAWIWSTSRRDGRTSLKAGFNVGKASGSFELTREAATTDPEQLQRSSRDAVQALEQRQDGKARGSQ